MNNLKLNQKIVTVFLVLLPAFSALAQEGFDDDTDDLGPAAVPIDTYVWIAIAVAIYIAFRIYKKQQLSTPSN